MLFSLPTLNGLVAGTVDRTYRRWTAVRTKPGARFTTRVGMVKVTAITPVPTSELTEQDAVAAGFGSRDALLRWTAAKGTGDLYRVDLVLDGPDPRVALRASGLTEDERAALDRRLDRMDAAADRPWTRRVLTQIADRPGVVSTELAAEAGEERAHYKVRVRRLKALGLTESLEIGYRLSPRGIDYLGRG